MLPVSFVSRGRRTLKGVSEPVAVFAVARSADPWATTAVRWFRRRRTVAGGAIVLAALVLVGLLAWTQLRPAAGLPPGPWTIGLDMPLTGGAAHRGVTVRNAVQLAIDDINGAGGISGIQLVLDARDDGGDSPDGQVPATGAANVKAMVADPRTLAMIGPWGSRVATDEIPITNAAGLLQCSPANTWPQLTKPREGALDLRAAHPDRINYIRTAPADDIQESRWPRSSSATSRPS